MHGADLMSLVLGALLGFGASITGLRLRRNWERFDHDQVTYRADLIDLARSAEAARVAVRSARIRGDALMGLGTSTETIAQLYADHTQVAEAVFEFSSRTRRLQPGSLRRACAAYGMMLRSYYTTFENPPSDDELDGAGLAVRYLIEGAINRVELAHASWFALRGDRLIYPPAPYSSPLAAVRS